MHIALIGSGKWGTAIARTLDTFPDVKLTVVEKGNSPPDGIDGVIIATPSATHAAVALPFIEQGIPTFIEKPLTTSIIDAERIREAVARSHTPVFVGHIYLYNPAFQKVKGLLPTLGTLSYVLSEKMNYGPRTDASVFWDWLPHDASMLFELFGTPQTVQAWGIARAGANDRYDMATIRFTFENAPASVSIISWLSPEKRKHMTFVGEKGALVFDDGAEKKLILYRGADVTYPEYESELPLTRELRVFIDSVRHKSFTSDGLTMGYRIVSLVAAAEASARAGGIRTDIHV